MVMLPAGFANCTTCGRLLVVDSLNVTGRCTRDCGGRADAYRLDWSPDSWPHLVPCSGPDRCVWCGQGLTDIAFSWGPCPGDAGNAIERWAPALDAMSRGPKEVR